MLYKIYENDIPKVDFIDRKFNIVNQKTFIYGPPRSGKTFIAYDFLQNFNPKERLYVDFSDMRIETHKIEEGLEEFINLNNIKAVVLDNFEFDLQIPECENIIIISSQYNKLENFSSLFVLPLDFEEYLAQDTKHQNITASFNNFLKFGNLPETLQLLEHKKIKNQQVTLKLLASDKIELFAIKIIVNSLGEKTSVYNLFNQLKRVTKISKDRFYELCHTYEAKGIIFFVSKYNQPKALKKLFLYNHSIKNALSFSKNFKAEFSNMVFLELIRNHKDIFYLDGIDFYLHESGSIIMCVPFYSDFMISTLSSKIFPLIDEYNIQSISIICVNDMQKSFFIGEIECTVVPFLVWALL
ncbi:ATP-binding protein [Arcobacter sp. FWKO B]|uniref:ATP-binding protein n=1 Tax=Arcobacter sp. FWKO B TaxID=2593672 RepID=UPI0018A45671|nr:ATP-binding protein [Arcobacter sp. FWKO B]QOG11890.1 ATP-binding protein [Arcobacter sp. FWKO B]